MDRPELRTVATAASSAEDAAAASTSDDALHGSLAAAEADELPAVWLAVQCRSTRGCRRGVLLLGPPDRGPFQRVATWPEGETGVPPSLIEAAQRALASRSGSVSDPGPGDGDGPARLEGSILAEPVEIGGGLHGAVALEIGPRPSAALAELRSRLRLAFGWLASWIQHQRAEAQRTRKGQLEVVLGLVAAALEHDRFRGAVTTLATELATELHCDRVSVGFQERGRVRVRGLSHSARFGERTNLIRSIEAAMDEALDQQANVVYPVAGAELPRAAHAHAELVRQFGSPAVCTVPLVRAGKACGAVTLERQKPFDEPALLLLEVVVALTGPVLESLRRDDRFIGTKLLESAGDGARKLVGPRHVAAKLIGGAIVLVVLVLAVAKGDYRITANTNLEPAVRRAAVAPFDGYVASAPVRPGDVVRAGEVIGSLDDRDLVLERVKWSSEHAQALKQYRQALAERDAARVQIESARVDESRAELDRIDDRLARTELVAPFDGVVVEGDLTQRLGAPVKRGEVLYEIAPLDSYRMNLMVDESDIAEVAVGQTGNLVLSALPNESFEFTVEKITPVAQVKEGRNAFRVEARLEDDSKQLRPGIEGVGKIEVGSRRLIWIWTHDVIEWLHLKLWAWTP